MKQASIKKNFIMNSILTMSSFVFPLITFPYVSRVLLPVGAGKVSFATSLVSYFSIIAQLGIPVYGIRACAKVRDDRKTLTRTVHELLFINLITCIISYIVFCLALIFVPRLQEERRLYIVISMTIFLSSIGMEWLYKALEQYTYITIRSIFFKFISIIAMFLLVKDTNDYVIYGGISIFASTASNLLNFINARRFIDLSLFKKYNLKKHVKPIVIFFAMTCATTIYTNLDTVMLGFMSTDEDVGHYYAAVRIKTVLVSLVTSLGAVLLPRASYYVEQNKMIDFERITEKALNYVLFIATPIMVFFMLFAKECIYFLSGTLFAGSIVPMIIIMPTLLLIGISNVLGMQVLVPLGQEKVVLYSEVAGAIIDIVINFALIPHFKSVGAAIGTLVAEMVVLLVQYCFVKNMLSIIFKKVHYISFGLAIIFSFVACFWIKNVDFGITSNMTYFLKLFLSGIVFFSTYFLFSYLKKEEIALEIINNLNNRFNRKC